MLLYHRTFAAPEILKSGFVDGHGKYLTDRVWCGVWFADRPLDINEGADGDVVLAVDIPDDLLEYYEWVEENKAYREFLVPAEVVNRYGPPLTLRNAEHPLDDRWGPAEL